MRAPLLALLLLSWLSPLCQAYDTVINAGPYVSYFSRAYKQPVFVAYTLHRGGGDCSRSGLKFKTGGLKGSATASDYARSGYDQGHLVPFEDFAYDCDLSARTFMFYNAIPQAPGLNRGSWSRWEDSVRRVSLRDTLVILAGGSGYKRKIGQGLYVPDYCWKVVYSRRSKVVLYALLFKNEDDAQPVLVTVKSLERKLGYGVRGLLK